MKIGRTVIISDEGGMSLIEPSKSLDESFGEGGDDMIEVAKEISEERRREVESERQ
jgi:hypothetical protein